MTRYVFAGLTRPIVLDAPTTIEPLFKFFLAHWPWTAEASDAPADITIEETADGLGLRAPALAVADGGYDETAAANQLSSVLVSMITRQQPDLFAAHASAVALDGGVIVLPGGTMSGKSTLALQLTRFGARHFGDDQVLLRVGDTAAPRAVALGLTPRMRLPMHALAGPDLARFVAARIGMQVGNFATVDLGVDEYAPFAAELPVRLVALPRVAPGTDWHIAPLARPVAVQTLLEQGRAPHWAKQRWLQAVGAALAQVRVVEIAFDKSDLAAEQLRRYVQA